MDTPLLILHAVLPASAQLSPALLAQGWPIRLIACEDVQLLITRHSLPAGLNAQALIEDADKAQALALAHNQVLSEIARDQDCIPVSLSGAYRDEAALLDHVKAQLARFRAALRETTGCIEMCVRVLQDPQNAAPKPSAPQEPPPASGRDYLKARLAARRSKTSHQQGLDDFHTHLDQGFARHARACVHLGAKIHPQTGEKRTFEGVYLVARQDLPAFIEAGRPVYEAALARGLTLDVSGPWPVYHFTQHEEEDVHAG